MVTWEQLLSIHEKYPRDSLECKIANAAYDFALALADAIPGDHMKSDPSDPEDFWYTTRGQALALVSTSSKNAIASPCVPMPNDMIPLAEEQVEFTVKLISCGPNKVLAIVELRKILNLGLHETKLLVESTPQIIKEGISKTDAFDIKQQLETAGCIVEVI